jgi:hypothetical protein
VIDTVPEKVLKAARSFPLIDAVVLGKQEGKTYSLSTEAYEATFILHKAAFGYLEIDGDKKKAFDDFLGFVKSNTELPAYFHLYEFDADLASSIDATGLKYKLRDRIQLQYKSKAVEQTRNPEFTIRLLQADDEQSLTENKLDNYKTFWPSYSEFLAGGYGTCAINKAGNILSVCYTAAVGEMAAEVDIITAPESRGKGLGRATTMAYIEESLRRNLIPNWDCFADNLASYEVALKTGFEVTKKYTFLSLFDPNKNN